MGEVENVSDEANEKVLLGKLARPAAERLQTVLSTQDLHIVVIHNQVSCQSGCTPEMEVWAHQEDVERILQAIRNEHFKEAQELNYDLSLLQSVFDPSLAEVTCPACAFRFEPRDAACPDCGLEFLPEVSRTKNCKR